MGSLFTAFVFDTIVTLYPTVNIGNVVIVFIVNYISGLALAWFAIDLSFSTIEFTNEWHRQKGESATCCVALNPNYCCCLSWCCCCCCCYYCCCMQTYGVTKVEDYPKDDNGNVIGSRNGIFAVTYHDYQAFIHKQPLSPRNLDNVLDKIGLNSPEIRSMTQSPTSSAVTATAIGDNNLNDKDALELNIQTASASQ